MTLDCIRPTQSRPSAARIIHRHVYPKCFFSISPKRFWFVIIVTHSYFIHILQGSVKTHLWCGGKYNNHIIENCAECASDKILNIGQQLAKISTKVKCHVFHWLTTYGAVGFGFGLMGCLHDLANVQQTSSKCI